LQIDKIDLGGIALGWFGFGVDFALSKIGLILGVGFRRILVWCFGDVGVVLAMSKIGFDILVAFLAFRYFTGRLEFNCRLPGGWDWGWERHFGHQHDQSTKLERGLQPCRHEIHDST
jgi:hypothetical protein